MISQHTISAPNLPEAFDGYRIAQVSDLHNAEFGPDNQKLLALLETTRPDLIAITGDLVDSRKTDTDIAIRFVREAMKIAPVYYVPGNHEARIGAYPQFTAALADAGVYIMENTSAALEKSGQVITLSGLTDPDFGIPWPDLQADTYHILLSHRPEKLDWYAQQGYDLVLSGHTHGGQFRLPFVGGLVAPHQGFLPALDAGLYEKDGTTMIVSRGLGSSVIPLRFNNRPELILVTLESI